MANKKCTLPDGSFRKTRKGADFYAVSNIGSNCLDVV